MCVLLHSFGMDMHSQQVLARAQDGRGGGRGGVVAPGQVLFCVGIVFFFFMGVLAQADSLICILRHEHSSLSTSATA